MIYNIVELLATITDFVFILWYVPRLLGTRCYYKENLKLLIVPAVLLTFELLTDFLFPGFELLVFFAYIALSLLYAILICQRQYFKAVLATSSYILAIMFVGSIVYMIISSITGDKALALQGADSIPRVIYLVVCKLTEYSIYLCFLSLFGKSGSLNRQSGIFFSIYLLLSVFGLATVTVISVEDTAGIYDTPVLIITAVLTLSLFFVYFFVHKLMSLQRKEYEYTFIEEKIATDKMILEESNVTLENLHKIRHDLKNHFTIIKGLLADGDIRSSEKYIDDLFPKIDTMGDIINTGNSVVDYLINAKFAKNKDIHVMVSGTASILNNMEDLDVVCLMGNLLENALEAVEKISPNKEKRIEVYFLTQNNGKIILCKNTVDKPVLTKNSRLNTSKIGYGHGYGNKIVDSVVKKYKGFIEYSESDGMFCAQIILP